MKKIDDSKLECDSGEMIIFYNIDTNDFCTYYGDMIYNLWDYFWPTQIFSFLKNPMEGKKLYTKQGKRIEIFCI